MTTAAILIGNSDDKLTQEKWSAYCQDVGWIISRYGARPHFSGHSVGSAPWQNACWVIDIPEDLSVDQLKFELGRIADKYRQDSIALLVGDTEFVKALGG